MDRISAAVIGGSDLTGANLSRANLTNADSELLDADGRQPNRGGGDGSSPSIDTTSRGFDREQLYPPPATRQKDLQGIRLRYNDLTGWDFADRISPTRI